MNRTDWNRVSRRQPCPICGKPDWCLYAGEPTNPEAAICTRIESPKRCGEAGWLHILHRDGPTWSPRIRRIELSALKIATPALDLDKLAAEYRQAVSPEAVDRLALVLGVTAQSLTRLGVGWAEKRRAWAFPMRSTAGVVLGIRLRLADGRKLAIKDGREGLFLPEGAETHRLLLVCEGPTDTAAMLDLGFHVIGRPSCMGGVKLLVDLVQREKPTGVVIVADGDPPGQRGAESLAAVMVAYCTMVRVIEPPAGIKDAREWKRSGATAADIQAAIEAAPARKLGVSIRRRKAGSHGV